MKVKKKLNIAGEVEVEEEGNPKEERKLRKDHHQKGPSLRRGTRTGKRKQREVIVVVAVAVTVVAAIVAVAVTVVAAVKAVQAITPRIKKETDL